MRSKSSSAMCFSSTQAAALAFFLIMLGLADLSSARNMVPLPGRWQLRMPPTAQNESTLDDLHSNISHDDSRARAELLKLWHIIHWHPFLPHFPKLTRRPPPPWSYNWGEFPVYIFPQNASGLESAAQIEVDVRYALVVIDGLHNVMNQSQKEEQSLYEQCQILRARKPSLVCFAYRQSWHALSNFAWSRIPALDPATNPFWWVVDDHGKLLNTSVAEYNLWGLLFDWRNETSQMFYLQNTIGEVLAESPVIQGAFFDDFDGEGCLRALNTSMPSHYNEKSILEMYVSRIKMYSEVIKTMNAHNMIPVLGMSTRFNSTANGCIVPEEAVLAAMGEVGFIREAIFDRPVAQSTPVGCGEFMRSTLEEVSCSNN